jgi:hypothetical protein
MPGLCSDEVADILFPERQYVKSSLYGALYANGGMDVAEFAAKPATCQCGVCKKCLWRQRKANWRRDTGRR